MRLISIEKICSAEFIISEIFVGSYEIVIDLTPLHFPSVGSYEIVIDLTPLHFPSIPFPSLTSLTPFL